MQRQRGHSGHSTFSWPFLVGPGGGELIRGPIGGLCVLSSAGFHRACRERCYGAVQPARLPFEADSLGPANCGQRKLTAMQKLRRLLRETFAQTRPGPVFSALYQPRAERIAFDVRLPARKNLFPPPATSTEPGTMPQWPKLIVDIRIYFCYSYSHGPICSPAL